jgi:hypothetical protein
LICNYYYYYYKYKYKYTLILIVWSAGVHTDMRPVSLEWVWLEGDRGTKFLKKWPVVELWKANVRPPMLSYAKIWAIVCLFVCLKCIDEYRSTF